MTTQPRNHNPSSGTQKDPEKKHPIRFYWLTGGLATIIVAIITVVLTHSLSGPNNPAHGPSSSSSQTGSTSSSAGNTSSGSDTSAPAHLSSPPAAGGPITGNWNVTYAAPATVTITLAGGVYTESAKTQVLVFPGTSCYIQPGIAIATFTQTGPGTYAGHARLWSENTCITDATTSMTVALSSDGNTLAESLKQATPGTLSNVTLTRT
jgi:hypothetical protein